MVRSGSREDNPGMKEFLEEKSDHMRKQAAVDTTLKVLGDPALASEIFETQKQKAAARRNIRSFMGTAEDDDEDDDEDEENAGGLFSNKRTRT